MPAGASHLRFETSGGTGDADLYVKFGSAPTSSSYDCGSYGADSNERCSITPVSAGTYYVKLQAYTAISGVSLKGSYTEGSAGD
ncbi:PPC domain-containing protein [Cystobacter fuscus]